MSRLDNRGFSLRWFLIGLASLLPLGCSSSTDQPEVAAGALQGGSPTNQMPEVGLLELPGGNLCTGTLIAPNVVLTAAHCLEQPAIAFYIGDGEPIPADQDRRPTNMVRTLADASLPHPAYRDVLACPSSFDIGLVHLERPVTNVPPAQFARRSELETWSTCLGVGFGLHTDDGHDTAQQKRYGELHIVEYRGDAVRANRGLAPPSDVSGADSNAYTDRGDSGGPLRCDQGILALTSCGPYRSPDGWYTLVEPYEPWIRETIAGWAR